MRGGIALALIVALAGCVTTPAADLDPSDVGIADLDAEGFSPVRFQGVKFFEADLGSVDGLRLHGDVYLPDAPADGDAPERYPTILMLSPYWGTGTQGDPELGYMPYDFVLQRLVPRGYAVVYGDLAGNGGSGGCWDFMGPVERKSAVAMVEAIAEQEWSNGKVAMHGLSYDGMTQIMAASDQAPHLVTVIPAAPLTSAYSGLRMGGVHYGGGWHQTISGYESATLVPPVGPFGANPGRVPGWSETVAASPRCLADNHAGDATGEYNDYYAARDYRALGADVKASVFYMQGFLDGAVKPDNYGNWFQGVSTLKKAWLGQWWHQYPNAEGSGRDDLYLTIHRWLDHELMGIDNGIDREPVVDVQDSLGRWRREASWPPSDAWPHTLYLSGDGALVEADPEEGTVSFGGPASLTDQALATGIGRATFGELALAKPLHIAGTPILNVTLSSDRPAGVVIARLYDGERMVTQGAYNLLFADGLETMRPVTPGEPLTLSVRLYPTDWLATDSLRIELSTQDAREWFDSDAPASTLTLQAGEGATLTLPLIERAPEAFFLTTCGMALAEAVPDCFDEDKKDLGVEDDS